MLKSETLTLKNGLRVIFVDTKAFPTLTTLLLIGAGSRYENKINNGISHFLEHMFFKGSEKYPTPEIVSTTIESLGGVWNAFTSKNYTGYYIKGASSHFEKMIDILSDILLRPKFEEKEIEKEKGVIIEEINMYEDQPQMKVGELFENLIFKDSPLAMDVIGTKETVGNISRQTILNYKRSLYQPNNAVLVVAGGLSQIQSPQLRQDFDGQAKLKVQGFNLKLKIIEKCFLNWEAGKQMDFVKAIENQNKTQKLIHFKKTEQAHFCLGYKTFGINDQRKYALSVLSTVLGGGASSRLFVEIRERRGLCYYIHTGRQLYEETGYIVTQAGVAKEKEKIKSAVKAVISEHQKIAKGSVSEEELVKVKEMIKGRMLLSLEDSFNVANYFGQKEIFEKGIIMPEEVIENINKVTKDQVVFLAKSLFSSRDPYISFIGPEYSP